MENSRSKQLIRFKMHSIRSSVMKSHSILLHSAPDENYLFVQSIVAIYATHIFTQESLSPCYQISYQRDRPQSHNVSSI